MFVQLGHNKASNMEHKPDVLCMNGMQPRNAFGVVSESVHLKSQRSKIHLAQKRHIASLGSLNVFFRISVAPKPLDANAHVGFSMHLH